ncbi:MAG: RidA family protein [Acidobacteriota bacterium]
MKKTVIQTQEAPGAIGPYSQAVRYGELLFCSGQVAIDPGTGAVIDGDVKEQTERVMKNLQEVLKAGGASWAGVVKTTIFLARMEDFAVVNEVYGSFVTPQPPARATVAVSGLPKGVLVEIEAVAVCGDPA